MKFFALLLLCLASSCALLSGSTGAEVEVLNEVERLSADRAAGTMTTAAQQEGSAAAVQLEKASPMASSVETRNPMDAGRNTFFDAYGLEHEHEPSRSSDDITIDGRDDPAPSWQHSSFPREQAISEWQRSNAGLQAARDKHQMFFGDPLRDQTFAGRAEVQADDWQSEHPPLLSEDGQGSGQLREADHQGFGQYDYSETPPANEKSLQYMTYSQQKAGLTALVAALSLGGGYVANSATQGNWNPTQTNWWARVGAGNNKNRLLRM